MSASPITTKHGCIGGAHLMKRACVDKRGVMNYREASPKEKAWKRSLQAHEIARCEFEIIERQRRVDRARLFLAGYDKVDNETSVETAAAYGWDYCTDSGEFKKRVRCNVCDEVETLIVGDNPSTFNVGAAKKLESDFYDYRYSRGAGSVCKHKAVPV